MIRSRNLVAEMHDTGVEKINEYDFTEILPATEFRKSLTQLGLSDVKKEVI